MPLKPATFKKAVIALTDGLPPEKANKVKGWIEHNGAKHSMEIDDDVTHLIISSKSWNNYRREPMVIEARRKRTIYLMKLVWLEDSLNFNKRSPLHEVDKKYTWELEHADKVMKKRKEKQILARKEKARARRAEAKEEAVIVRTDDQEHESIEDKNRYGRTQQIVYCGIKFDKPLLEFERDMALDGYRPYVNENDFTYLVTLVRNDVYRDVQEQYDIRLYESFNRPSPPAADKPPMPEVTPQINHSSFTSYISGCSSRAITAPSASTTKKAPRPHPTQEKSYAVYLHYTNKATNPRMKTQETTEFAPKGSTWDFAYTMFKKFFQKKTDLCWEQALNGSADNAVDADSRRDSGVDLSSCRQESHATGLGVEDANTIVASHQPFRYIPAHVGELACFEKKYANRYGEDWLPTPRAVVASSQHGKFESEEMLMKEGLAEVDEVEGLDQDVNNVEQFCKEIVEHNMRDGTNELVSERAEQCENGAVERGAVIVKNV